MSYQMTRMTIQSGKVGVRVQFADKTTLKRQAYFTMIPMAPNVRKRWEETHAAYKTGNGMYFIPSKVG